VAYGHVGNAAAAFALQRLGVEVWPVHTVQFSNHPGYGDRGGRVASGAEVTDVVAGIERRGVFGGCDAVLSGYMGDASVAEAVLDAVRWVRAANPAALFCCDPVIGDGGQVYVQPAIPGLIADRVVPQADLLTPNQFELERLTGITCTTAAAVRQAITQLRGRMRPDGPRAVLLTSAVLDETPEGTLDVVAADDHGLSALRVERLDVAASGAGDVTAALFLYHYLAKGQAGPAMAAAAASVHGLLRRTAAAGSRELLLIAAQDELVAPTSVFATSHF